MSGPRITDAAVEAGARAWHAEYEAEFAEEFGIADLSEFETPAKLILTAALPHIRRAVIEELAEKYEDEAERNRHRISPARMFDGTPFPDISDAAGAARRLRAELEGDDRG